MSSIFRLRDKNDWEKRRGNHTIRGIRLTRDSWPDDRRDLKCRKARPQRPRLQMSEALMLQSVPPYVDTPRDAFSSPLFNNLRDLGEIEQFGTISLAVTNRSSLAINESWS